MISEKIHAIVETLSSGGQSAPLLVSEEVAQTTIGDIFQVEIQDLEALEEKSIADFFWYDCANKKQKKHSVEILRKFTEQLYQTPSGNIMVVLFLHLDALTLNAHNALLKLFEDVPQRLLILVTSHAPEKIIPTLQSRIISLENDIVHREHNPFQAEIDDFVLGHTEGLFSLTLGKEFSKEQALWVVTGLQNAVLNGTLSPRKARYIRETRLTLETTNTIAKYLIDQLLITLLCE